MLPVLFALAFLQLNAAEPQPDRKVQGFQSASALLDKCKGSSLHGQEYCYAYLAAVADSVVAYQTWLNLRDLCIPGATSQGQLKDAYIGYLVENPSQVQGQAASVVVTALQSKFPCKAEPAPVAAPTGGGTGSKPADPAVLPPASASKPAIAAPRPQP